MKIRTLTRITSLAFAVALLASCTGDLNPEKKRAAGVVVGASGQIRVDDGSPGGGESLSGVEVKLGDQSTRTDENGFWTIEKANVTEGRAVVRYSRDGYAPYTQIIEAREGLYLRSRLARAVAQQRVKVSSGGVLTGDPDGTGKTELSVVLPPNFAAFKSDDVDVTVSVVRAHNEAELRRFPGEFVGQDEESTQGSDLIETFGTINVSFREGGKTVEDVQLTQPVRMQIRLDAEVARNYNEGDQIETWWFDETQGTWMREGASRVVIINGEKYAEWEVKHFTWWNVDAPLETHASVNVNFGGLLSESGGPGSESGAAGSQSGNTLSAAEKEALKGFELVLKGVSYKGETVVSFAGGSAVATGKRNECVQLFLRPRNGEFSGLEIQLKPESASEGDTAKGTFCLPDTVGSAIWNVGPDGVPFDPNEHALQVKRGFPLKLGRVSGSLVDSNGAAIADAVVAIEELGLTARTDGAGRFEFKNVAWTEDGSVKLTVTAVEMKGRKELRTEPIKLTRNQADQIADLVAKPFPRAPSFVYEAVSHTQAASGTPVVFELAVLDNEEGVAWSFSPSAGTVDGKEEASSSEGDLFRATVKATWNPGTAEGKQTLTATATDAAGLKKTAVLAVHWHNRAPILSLSGPSYGVVGETITLTATAVDPEGAPLTYMWEVNNDTAGTSANLTLPLNTEGALVVRALVSDGKLEVYQDHTIIVSAAPVEPVVAPNTNITSGHPAVVSATTAVVSFTSPASGVTFQCYLDAPPASLCTSPVNLTGLDEGQHTFVVAAVDTEENADQTPAFVTWRIDLTKPTVSITTAPPTLTQASVATLTFTGSDAGGLSGYECRVNASAWQSCTSPWQTPALGDGDHTAQVRSVDLAGWRSPAAEASWTVEMVTALRGFWEYYTVDEYGRYRRSRFELACDFGWSSPDTTSTSSCNQIRWVDDYNGELEPATLQAGDKFCEHRGTYTVDVSGETQVLLPFWEMEECYVYDGVDWQYGSGATSYSEGDPISYAFLDSWTVSFDGVIHTLVPGSRLLSTLWYYFPDGYDDAAAWKSLAIYGGYNLYELILYVEYHAHEDVVGDATPDWVTMEGMSISTVNEQTNMMDVDWHSRLVRDGATGIVTLDYGYSASNSWYYELDLDTPRLTIDGIEYRDMPYWTDPLPKGQMGSGVTYSVTPQTYAWNIAADAGEPLYGSPVYQWRRTFDLPFAVDFYGITYNHLTVSTYGLVGFGYTFDLLGYFEMPSFDLASLALNAGEMSAQEGGVIRYAVTGTAPNRTLVVSFFNMGSAEFDPLTPGTGTDTYQLVIEEASPGQFLIQYQSIADVGVAGTNLGEYSTFTSWAPSTGTAYLVTPE